MRTLLRVLRISAASICTRWHSLQKWMQKAFWFYSLHMWNQLSIDTETTESFSSRKKESEQCGMSCHTSLLGSSLVLFSTRGKSFLIVFFSDMYFSVLDLSTAVLHLGCIHMMQEDHVWKRLLSWEKSPFQWPLCVYKNCPSLVPRKSNPASGTKRSSLGTDQCQACPQSHVVNRK